MPSGPGRPPERYLSSSEEEYEAAQRATDRYLRRGARLACFTLDRPRSGDATPGTLFHRGWARARMWEQYADHHSGACLVFKRQELELVDEHRPHGNGDLFTYGGVTYQDQALTVPLPWTDVVDQGIEAVLDDFQIRKDAAKHLYTTKNTDWESEQEFRIVHVQWDVPDEKMDVPISIPFEASLEAIVLGEHFPDTERNVMQFRAGMPAEIDLLQCQWHSRCADPHRLTRMHPLEEPDPTDYVGDVTVETQIANLQMEGPHVFLLGVGASKAALPNGDKEGRHVALILWGLFGDGSRLSQNHRK